MLYADYIEDLLYLSHDNHSFCIHDYIINYDLINLLPTDNQEEEIFPLTCFL